MDNRTMKKYQAVIFDLDGTLIDSSEGITKSAQYALEHYGIKEELGNLYKFIGPPLVRSFQEHYGFPEEQAREAVAVYRERYNKIGIFECSLYPGVEECIRRLKAQGYFIGMGSSKPEISCRRILEHFGILDLFDDVTGATMDGRVDTKTEVLRAAMARMPQYQVSDMVLIGDTMFDVNGANEVGMDTIGVTFGFGNLEDMKKAGIVAVCERMEDLPTILEEL